MNKDEGLIHTFSKFYYLNVAWNSRDGQNLRDFIFNWLEVQNFKLLCGSWKREKWQNSVQWNWNIEQK